MTLARDGQMTEGKDDRYQKDRQRDKEEHRNWNKRNEAHIREDCR